VPRTWQCMGSIRDMYGYNLEHPGGLLGPDYVELWVMRNYHRGCDLYMRRSTVIPREQFSHFSINVSDPAFFFAASRWIYVGETIDTEWAAAIPSRL